MPIPVFQRMKIFYKQIVANTNPAPILLQKGRFLGYKNKKNS